MIEKQWATQIQEHALRAISELSDVLDISQGRCSPEEYESIKRSIGRAIGIITTELLDDVVYKAYPELDDLK